MPRLAPLGLHLIFIREVEAQSSEQLNSVVSGGGGYPAAGRLVTLGPSLALVQPYFGDISRDYYAPPFSFHFISFSSFLIFTYLYQLLIEPWIETDVSSSPAN
jgi:hypothetical protein